MNGWLKLFRKIDKWEWIDTPEMVALWVRILLEANVEDNTWHGETYEKGTFPTSVRKLSIQTGLSDQTIRTCLKKLESSKQIKVDSTNKGTKISVLKWGEYQGLCDDTNEQITNISTSRATSQLTTLKEEKKKRNNNTPYNPPTLDEVREYCKSRNSSVNPDTFYEYFTAGNWKDSKGNPVRNWKQKLITWENHRNTNSVSKEEDKTVPTYDDTNNVCLPDNDLADILKEMRRI